MNFIMKKGYWDDINNQKRFLDKIAKELHIREPTDWYKVKHADIRKRGGSALLKRYDHSLIKTLIGVYPNYKLEIRKFNKVPQSYWESITNQRNFLEEIAKNLNITQLDDWYRVTQTDLKKRGGSALLKRYGYSVRKILLELYPDHNWKTWLFPKVPIGFWNELNTKQFITNLKKDLNLTDLFSLTTG